MTTNRTLLAGLSVKLTTFVVNCSVGRVAKLALYDWEMRSSHALVGSIEKASYGMGGISEVDASTMTLKLLKKNYITN